MGRPEIGVSSCLLGLCVRYNGESKYNEDLVRKLSKGLVFVPFCPEYESGMPIPREPMDLYEMSGEVRLLTVSTRRDMTGTINSWVEKCLCDIKSLRLKGFVLKSGSPSCGICSARIHKHGVLYKNGTGIFADALKRSLPNIPLVQDTDLNTSEKIASFIVATGGQRAES